MKPNEENGTEFFSHLIGNKPHPQHWLQVTTVHSALYSWGFKNYISKIYASQHKCLVKPIRILSAWNYFVCFEQNAHFLLFSWKVVLYQWVVGCIFLLNTSLLTKLHKVLLFELKSFLTGNRCFYWILCIQAISIIGSCIWSFLCGRPTSCERNLDCCISYAWVTLSERTLSYI